jgi:hypothetical protein
MMILRARAVDARGPPPPSQTRGHAARRGLIEWQPAPSMISQGNPLVSNWDPFLTPAISDEYGVAGDGFADFFREIFGPEFGDLP